jgi:hypothetical protein
MRKEQRFVQEEGKCYDIIFRYWYVHHITGKRVYSNTGRPFPIPVETPCPCENSGSNAA